MPIKHTVIFVSIMTLLITGCQSKSEEENTMDSLNKLSREGRLQEQFIRIDRTLASVGKSTEFRASHQMGDLGYMGGYFLGTLKNNMDDYEISLNEYRLSYSPESRDYPCGYYNQIYTSISCNVGGSVASKVEVYEKSRKVCSGDDMSIGDIGKKFIVKKLPLASLDGCKITVHLVNQGESRRRMSQSQFGTNYYW